MSEVREGSPSRWAIAAAALSAALLTLVVARFDRPAVGPDAVAYVAIADSLRAGDGIGFWLEDPLTTWPPLWPALIWLGMLVSGARADLVALVLNAAAVAGCVVASIALARRVLRTHTTTTVLVVSLAVSPLLIGLAVLVQTEILFALLVLLVLLSLLRWADEGAPRWLVAAGLLTATAFYVRYQAAYVVPVFAGWIGLRVLVVQRRFWPAVRDALWYTVPALAPAIVWIVRNLSLSDTALGPRFPSDVGPAANLAGAFATTFKFLSSLPTAPTLPAAALTVVVLAVAVVVLERSTRPEGQGLVASLPSRLEQAVVGPVGLLVTFVGVFTLLMVITRSLVGFDDLDIRLLAPCYVPTSLLFLRWCEVVLIERPARATWGRAVVGVWLGAQILVCLALVGPANSAVADYGFNADRAVAVSTSPILDELPDGCVTYSNNAGDLYHSGFQAQISPRKVEYKSDEPTDDLAELREAVRSGERSCLVWVGYSEDDEYYSVGELSDEFVLEDLAEDGELRTYVIRAR